MGGWGLSLFYFETLLKGEKLPTLRAGGEGVLWAMPRRNGISFFWEVYLLYWNITLTQDHLPYKHFRLGNLTASLVELLSSMLRLQNHLYK